MLGIASQDVDRALDAAVWGADEVVAVDLNRPMDEIRAELTKYPVKTRLSLTGTLVVARDIAHAKIAERLGSEEISCFRVRFPRGMDANDYALKVTPPAQSLAVVLRSALVVSRRAKRRASTSTC